MNENPEFGDTYRLLWRRPGTNYVGEVRNYTLDRKGYRRVPILLDDALMKEINMRFLTASWDDKGPAINVSTTFMMIPRRLREAGIWHEIGHIHHEHHLSGEFRDQSQLRAARLTATKNGLVLPIEEEADRFAVQQSGKEALIDFLEYILGTRPSGEKLGLNEIGKRELEIRIASIRASRWATR